MIMYLTIILQIINITKVIELIQRPSVHWTSLTYWCFKKNKDSQTIQQFWSKHKFKRRRLSQIDLRVLRWYKFHLMISLVFWLGDGIAKYSTDFAADTLYWDSDQSAREVYLLPIIVSFTSSSHTTTSCLPPLFWRIACLCVVYQSLTLVALNLGGSCYFWTDFKHAHYCPFSRRMETYASFNKFVGLSVWLQILVVTGIDYDQSIANHNVDFSKRLPPHTIIPTATWVSFKYSKYLKPGLITFTFGPVSVIFFSLTQFVDILALQRQWANPRAHLYRNHKTAYIYLNPGHAKWYRIQFCTWLHFTV